MAALSSSLVLADFRAQALAPRQPPSNPTTPAEHLEVLAFKLAGQTPRKAEAILVNLTALAGRITGFNLEHATVLAEGLLDSPDQQRAVRDITALFRKFHQTETAGVFSLGDPVDLKLPAALLKDYLSSHTKISKIEWLRSGTFKACAETFQEAGQFPLPRVFRELAKVVEGLSARDVNGMEESPSYRVGRAFARSEIALGANGERGSNFDYLSAVSQIAHPDSDFSLELAARILEKVPPSIKEASLAQQSSYIAQVVRLFSSHKTGELADFVKALGQFPVDGQIRVLQAVIVQDEVTAQDIQDGLLSGAKQILEANAYLKRLRSLSIDEIVVLLGDLKFAMFPCSEALGQKGTEEFCKSLTAQVLRRRQGEDRSDIVPSEERRANYLAEAIQFAALTESDRQTWRDVIQKLDRPWTKADLKLLESTSASKKPVLDKRFCKFFDFFSRSYDTECLAEIKKQINAIPKLFDGFFGTPSQLMSEVLGLIRTEIKAETIKAYFTSLKSVLKTPEAKAMAPNLCRDIMGTVKLVKESVISPENFKILATQVVTILQTVPADVQGTFFSNTLSRVAEEQKQPLTLSLIAEVITSLQNPPE